MLNANDTQLNLECWFSENKRFWETQKQEPIDEREAFRRAFEWDLIELFNAQGCLHEYGKMNGDELDTRTVLDFFKYRCMDIYGRDWEEHYKGYGLKQNQ